MRNWLDDFAEIVAGVPGDDAELYLAAMQCCREKLSATDDDLLQMRYVEELSTVEIANRLQRLQPSVSRSLNRIRRWLLECIQAELARQNQSEKYPL